MSEYQEAYLCRVKVFKDKQAKLFELDDLSVQELLKQTIESKPRAILKRNVEWEIANIEEVDENAIYFRLGRTKNTVLGMKDKVSGDYQDEAAQINPNTSVLLDWKMELLMFIPNSDLCQPDAFPKRLQELLNSCEFAKEKGITPHIYIENVRIRKASSLLASGIRPSDAAIMAGFSDQSHFTNVFSRYIGLTPGTYFGIFRGQQ